MKSSITDFAIDAIENRFDTYSKEADPIINFYKNKKILYEIDGTRSIEAINSEISSIISSLKGWLYELCLYK